MPDYVTTPDYGAKFNALRHDFRGGRVARSQAPLPASIASPPADPSTGLDVRLPPKPLLQGCGWRSIEPPYTAKVFVRLQANLPMRYLLRRG
jgi:hypothetical protein